MKSFKTLTSLLNNLNDKAARVQTNSPFKVRVYYYYYYYLKSDNKKRKRDLITPDQDKQTIETTVSVKTKLTPNAQKKHVTRSSSGNQKHKGSK